jgi:hypothetical protein
MEVILTLKQETLDTINILKAAADIKQGRPNNPLPPGIVAQQHTGYMTDDEDKAFELAAIDFAKNYLDVQYN